MTWCGGAMGTGALEGGTPLGVECGWMAARRSTRSSSSTSLRRREKTKPFQWSSWLRVAASGESATVGRPGGGLLGPRRAPMLLGRRSRVRRSGLGPWRHQAGAWVGTLRQGGRLVNPAAPRRVVGGEAHRHVPAVGGEEGLRRQQLGEERRPRGLRRRGRRRRVGRQRRADERGEQRRGALELGLEHSEPAG